jgi:hypothetical protein
MNYVVEKEVKQVGIPSNISVKMDKDDGRLILF